VSGKDKTYPLNLPGQSLAQEPSAPPGAFDRWCLRRLFEVAGQPDIEIVLWDGATGVGEGARGGRLHVHSRGALLRLLSNPQVQFGDLYSVGAVEVDGDLVRFLESVYPASDARANVKGLHRLVVRLAEKPRSNSLHGSRDNIQHHYDLGNDFYELWLDPEMQYTCAYFPDPALDLHAAQLAKLEHVCRKLQLRPGMRVVEAGCGWGGLARYMARTHGVRVVAYNISREQVAYARERAQREGLAGQVEYVLDDYRNIRESFDAFVSVGMLEHVGPENYRELGAVIDRCLAPDGRGLIHSIGRNRPRYMNGWIERRIFPGAYPPTLREAMDIFEPYDLSVLDVENLRMHYARTLQFWLENYDHNASWVRGRFDEAFYRAWRLYLAGSIAAFTTGSLQLFQLVFARARDNELPWSRAHLYRA